MNQPLSASIAIVPETVRSPSAPILKPYVFEALPVFDPDLLRVAEGWNGGYLKLQGIAFDMQHGINPEVKGVHRFGTRAAQDHGERQGHGSQQKKTAPHGHPITGDRPRVRPWGFGVDV